MQSTYKQAPGSVRRSEYAGLGSHRKPLRHRQSNSQWPTMKSSRTRSAGVAGGLGIRRAWINLGKAGE